ncbi:Eukaryotic translation initiation factor 2-alpha kinase 4 [Trichuris trichiura]|uniref:Eukaryotic translation initiation factor 2-alpha kinase 4 n=1 Tax=Trichuris trichiura TaxID=36087 RepID=A0A077ZG80_TRITR|nr:Eukaryotic translation initiation factor 2-alpha kinase 4 [Trichuris trichiura]
MLKSERGEIMNQERCVIGRMEAEAPNAVHLRSKDSKEKSKFGRDALWFQKSFDSSLCFDNCALCDTEKVFSSADLALETTPKEYADGLVILSNGVRIRKSVAISLSQTYSNFIGFVEGSQHVVNLTEWQFEIGDSTSKRLDLLVTELENIRNSFQKLKSVQHKNVFKYLAFTFRVMLKAVQVVVVKQSCHCLPLSRMLARKYGNTSSSVLKMVSENLLEGLHYLHRHGFVHGALDLTCLWESKNCFHMADFTLKRQLQLLQTEWIKPDGKFNLKELLALRGDAKEQRQNDLYSLGVCLCELACGRSLNGIVDAEVLSSLQPEVRKFISLLITGQEAERWPCRLLLTHCFLDGGTSLDSGHANFEGGTCNEASASLVDASCLANYALSKRMCEEFDVIRLIGKGGFGDVTEVRNKLDGCRYAIKRVPLVRKNNIADAKILREVQLLSHLNHNNVVRYFNSWIETGVLTSKNERTVVHPLRRKPNDVKGNDSFLEALLPKIEIPPPKQESSSEE